MRAEVEATWQIYDTGPALAIAGSASSRNRMTGHVVGVDGTIGA